MQTLPGYLSDLRLFPYIVGEEKWEVEDIIDSRNKNGVKEFLVHWKGYPETERTWELETNITNAKQLLKAYKRRQRQN